MDKRKRFAELSKEREEDLQGFRKWLYEKELAECTIASYSDSYKSYFTQFEELNKTNMIRFKRGLIESHSPATAELRRVGMNSYCDYAQRPECKIKGIKRSNRAHREDVPTLEEYHYLLECLEKDENWKMYYMIKFFAKTGARASELLRMKKTDLEKREAEMWNKGRARRILIPDALIEESRWYFDTVKGEWLFPNRSGGQMTVRGIAMAHKLEKYGVRKEVLHPHAFRHLFAIMFLKKSKNVALLADLMGHSSVDTTRIYLALSAQEQKDRLNKATSAR